MGKAVADMQDKKTIPKPQSLHLGVKTEGQKKIEQQPTPANDKVLSKNETVKWQKVNKNDLKNKEHPNIANSVESKQEMEKYMNKVNTYKKHAIKKENKSTVNVNSTLKVIADHLESQVDDIHKKHAEKIDEALSNEDYFHPSLDGLIPSSLKKVEIEKV